MAHNVEKMMFTGRRPWWYGNQAQGTAVGVDLGENAVTSEVAMKAAGLDWRVEKTRAGWLDERTRDLDGAPVWRESAGDRFLVRDSDGSVLGRCTDAYKPLQNAEAFEFLDGLVAEGSLLYHTAGSLEGGGRVWILAQTPEVWTVRRRSGAENHHHAFLLAMLGHDGKSGVNLMPTDVRAECANTVGYAEQGADAKALIFRVPHSGDVRAKMGLAVQALKVMETETQARRAVLQALAQTAMSSDEFLDFATSIFLGLDGEAAEVGEAVAKFYETASDQSAKIMKRRVADVTRLFVGGMAAEGDSAYDALNAWTEYFDHFDLDGVKSKIAAGKRAAKAVTSSWIGIGAERKALVWKRLVERARA